MHQPAHPSSPPVQPLLQPRWNPYLVGLLIGLLSWTVFVLVDKPLGMSTAVAQGSGACLLPFLGQDGVTDNAYWAKYTPKWDYGTLFLIGSLIGAALSALTSRSFKLETVPLTWRERFGDSKPLRFLVAFLGGALMLFAARLAGGCTSGHGISGTLQLAVSSWTFFIVMFAAGIVTARLVFPSDKTRSNPTQN